MSRTLTRWAVPATVAVAVLGVAAAATALRASADPELAPRSAAQLLVDLQTAKLEGLSGTVVQRAELGLGSLPMLGGGGNSISPLSLLSGSHTLRVWYSGPDKARVALLGTLGESDIIHNGTDVWYWSSQGQSATHYKLPASPERSTVDKPSPDKPRPDSPLGTPQQVADEVLKALDPSTQVTTNGTIKVAGRSAYELVLSPRDKASLISQIRLAVDGEKHLPLRVQVLAVGQATPAFEVGFTQVSFDRPGDEHFTFTPPAGTKVTEGNSADAKSPLLGGKPGAGPLGGAGPMELLTKLSPKTSGSGWTTVLSAKLPEQKDGDGLGPLLATLPAVSGSWGSGHLLRSALLTVLVTDDGRVFAGLVTPDRLYEVASGK